ncbi:beta-class phenol-soluble modulin, partial [Staphylococcus aureus]
MTGLAEAIANTVQAAQ